MALSFTTSVCALFLIYPSTDFAAGQPGATKAAYSEYVRTSFYVPVRDGTRLAMNVYRPAAQGKLVEQALPVIFLFTPYRARYRDAEGKTVELALSERLGLGRLTDYGYVVATADIRGKGASFGNRRGFQDRTEALDGRDLVEWLARQHWSNGKVGMTGCSYLGGTTIQVATTAPPSLKAVFAGATDFDKYAFVRRGGITAQFNTRPDEPPEIDLQSIPVDEDPDGEMLKAAVAEHAANTPMGPLWYGMPYRDSESLYTGNRFWDEVGPYTYIEQLKNSGIHFYLWDNWSDEPTEQVILAAANLDAKLFIGPGTHCVPTTEFEFAREVRRFFDRYLKGIDNGIDREPRYTWRLQNGPPDREWIKSNELPGVGVERHSVFLAPEGSLLFARPAEGTATFQVNYGFKEQEYFSFWPDSLDDHGLFFTSPELDEDQALVGFPIIDLKLALDQADANLFAYVEDVAPGGAVTVVSFGRLAASHRALSEAPYGVMGMPWHSGLSGAAFPMEPGAAARMKFSLLPNAWVFKAGHRIRLNLTGADPRQRNLLDIARDPAPQFTIFMGGAESSVIHLPLIPPAQIQSE